MYGVYVGKPLEPTGFRWVKEIRDFREIDGKRYSVTETDDRVFIYAKEEVVWFPKDQAVGRIGDKYFKIPEKYIEGV